MKFGLWNIDHPEFHGGKPLRNSHFEETFHYLCRRDCDIYIITEANAALQLPGYQAYFSAESPFRNQSRCYDGSNQYYQVGIYSKLPMTQCEIDEPINGVLCKSNFQVPPFHIYGNVITIKDQWARNSDKTFSDRLQEQLAIFGQLAPQRCISVAISTCKWVGRNEDPRINA